jgi:hypothetical protein
LLSEKLLYGKANLADMLVKYQSIQQVVPKLLQLKKDFEFQALQVDQMKSFQSDFVKSTEIRTALDVIKSDTKQYTDEKMRENYKEMNFLVEDKLKALNNLPNKTDYVRRMDFMRF